MNKILKPLFIFYSEWKVTILVIFISLTISSIIGIIIVSQTAAKENICQSVECTVINTTAISIGYQCYYIYEYNGTISTDYSQPWRRGLFIIGESIAGCQYISSMNLLYSPWEYDILRQRGNDPCTRTIVFTLWYIPVIIILILSCVGYMLTCIDKERNLIVIRTDSQGEQIVLIHR